MFTVDLYGNHGLDSRNNCPDHVTIIAGRVMRTQKRSGVHWILKVCKECVPTGCNNFLFSWLPGRASLAIKLLAQTCPNNKT